MDTRFTARFRELNDLDIDFPRTLTVGQGTIFSMDLFKLPEVLSVMDQERMLFKAVSRRTFANLLRDIVRAAESPDFTPDEIRPIEMALERRNTPVARLLVCCKLLEEIAIRSQDEAVWRSALSVLAAPLYRKSTPDVAGTALDRISLCCLSAIRESCPEQGKRDMCSEIMSGAREDFVIEAVCGCLFTKLHREREQRAAAVLAGMDDPMVLAALVAHSLRSNPVLPNPADQSGLIVPGLMDSQDLASSGLIEGFNSVSSGVLDTLVRIGAAIDPKEGKSIIMAHARGDPYAPVDNAVHRRLVLGFRRILSQKEIPHPWFHSYRSSCFPVPRFDPNGIQLASFDSLARMPSGAALLAAVDGATQLAWLHIREVQEEGVDVSEPSVKSAMGRINRAVYHLLKRNPFIQPFQAEYTMRLLFAHPERLSPDDMHGGALLGMSPLFCRIALGLHSMGLEDSVVFRIASDCLAKGLGSDPHANMPALMELQGRMFGNEPHLPEPALTKEFLKSIAKRGTLPPASPGNRTRIR